MLTVTDAVEAKAAAGATAGSEVTLAPYGLIRRQGTPHVAGFYILHEGPLGVMGEQGLQEFTYASLDKETVRSATERGKEFTQRRRRLGRHHRQVLGFCRHS